MSIVTKAVVLNERGGVPTFQNIELPEIKENQVHIKIRTAALNHRDVWIQQGRYAKIQYPCILGSDGCGIVTTTANEQHRDFVGKRVIIHPSLHWGDNPKAQSPQFQVLGMPTNGTFAHDFFIDADRVFEAPEHLSDSEAAALPLVGLTAWRALMRQGNVETHHKVLITGIGGGVALMAAQFALALNAEVWVTSGNDEKIKRAIGFGATDGILYSEDGWGKKLLSMSGGFDCIIDGTGGETLNELLEAIKPGGKIVCYGATLGAPEKFNIHRLFWKQFSIVGSTMGNDEDFLTMIDFVNEKRIKPIVDSVYPFTKADEVFNRLSNGKQFGKIVLTRENE